MADNLEPPKVQFRVSLARPIQLQGADRRAIIMSIFIGAYVGFIASVGFHLFVGLPLGVVLWGVLTYLSYKAGKKDPFFIDILIRSLRYRSFYSARGRFNSFLRNYREW